MNANFFMATFSAAGRLSDRKLAEAPVVNDGPRTILVDRFNGRKTIQVRLYWNGRKYVELSKLSEVK
jgi:hypothetical protein